MALQLMQRAVAEKKRASSSPDSKSELTTIQTQRNTIGTPTILSLVRRMNEGRELPSQFTDGWERKILEIVIKEQTKLFPIVK